MKFFAVGHSERGKQKAECESIFRENTKTLRLSTSQQSRQAKYSFFKSALVRGKYKTGSCRRFAADDKIFLQITASLDQHTQKQKDSNIRIAFGLTQSYGEALAKFWQNLGQFIVVQRRNCYVSGSFLNRDLLRLCPPFFIPEAFLCQVSS